jgi:hypothetical protein
MLLRTAVVVLFAAVLLLPASVFATDVQTGFDPVVHVPPSFWDFGPIPLPADFFGPGSDPFDGGVPADAVVIPTSPHCPGFLGNTDMLIERKDVAVLPGIPSTDVIDIEIVELSLVSVSPITVTYNGGLSPEMWDVEITLSPSLASTGMMTIRQEHSNGGTFDAQIFLQPQFTFTRVSDSTVRILDGAGAYEDLLNAIDVPWTYSDPSLTCPNCVTNFIPGHDGVIPSDFSFVGTSSLHTVRCGCISGIIPTLSQWGLIIVATMLLVLGGYTIVRRRRTANGFVQ